jgi:hypothetical protein
LNSTLSLPVYIFETFFVCFLVLFFVSFLLEYLFFPIDSTSLLSFPSHPSILTISTAIITARKNLLAQSTGTITTPRAMMGRLKKRETSFPTAINYYKHQREIKKTDTQIQTPTK